ncbi:DUF488 family protein [Bartonella tribocorum]|uniref:DUF488 family protein n=1 Tax=Bartonella tribocorum TaxID=85701 RepID=UPI0032AF5BFA
MIYRGNRARDAKDFNISCLMLWGCFLLPAPLLFRIRKLNVPNIKHTIPPSAKDEKFCFFTIGYEGKSLENYLNCLLENNIKILCDVRKNPISRKYGFSKRL